MSNPKQSIPAKADLKGKSIAEVQAAIRGLMILAKKATFNVHSAYALSINCGMCIVDFAEDELDFSPDGYDERDLVTGVGIDIENDVIFVVTCDSTDTTNYLGVEECPMEQKDWVHIYDTLHDILTKADIYA